MAPKQNDIIKLLEIILYEKLGEKPNPESILRWFVESGILSRRHVLRFLIKYEFHNRMKRKDEKTRRLHIKMDLADEYNVSLETVNNIIYRYSTIKP